MNKLNLSPKDIHHYAKTQGVTYAAIHNRMRLGWTLDQIKAGHAKCKKRSPLLKKLNLKEIALRQNVLITAIYERIDKGWTEKEIIRGHRHYKNRSARNNEWGLVLKVTSGRGLFLAFIHIFILAVFKLPDETPEEKSENYRFTCMVYKGLLENKYNGRK